MKRQWSTLKKLIWLRFVQGAGAIAKVVTGTVPLTLENAISSAIKSLTQYGLCSQASTPTPASPVDIKCNNGTLMMVDDELPLGYKRLVGIGFDGDIHYETGESLTGDDDVTMTLDNTATQGQNVFGSYNGTSSGTKNFSLFIYGGGSTSNSYFRYGDQLLRPRFGTGKRTITFGKSGTDGFLTDASATPDTFTTPANAYIGMLPNSTSPPYTGDIIGNIVVGTRLKWIPCERESDNAIGYYEAVNGNFLTPVGTGTPTSLGYDYSNAHLAVVGTPEVLSVGGKNWFGSNASPSDRTYLDSAGGTGTSANWTLSDFIAVNPATQYTFNPNTTAGASAKIGYYTAGKTFISAIDSGGQTFTTPNDCYFMRFSYRNESTNIQLELGATATTYEPYVAPQTASVPDLYAVGAYKDEAEIISGAVTRRIGVYVFDGTETWIDGNYGYITETVQDQSGDTYSPLCTHYKGTTGTPQANTNSMRCYRTSGNVGRIYIAPNRTTYPTKEDFAAFVKAQYEAGTPIIVLYPLAEPTTESVTPQSLSTVAGTNVISITAEVSPIELEVEYKATA